MIKFDIFNNWKLYKLYKADIIINIFGFNVYKYGFEIGIINYWFHFRWEKE